MKDNKTCNHSFFYRSTSSEQQDLDLTIEPLNTINQRFTNSSTQTRSTSFASTKNSNIPLTQQTSPPHKEPIIGDSRSRHNVPLLSTTNKMCLITESNSRFQHFGQSNNNTNNTNTQNKSSTERGRTFVHHSDSRPFVLTAAIQMKPIDDKRRPCHRQNALRYKLNEQERQTRIPTPILTNISRYQSIERRITPSPQPPPMKSFSFDINHELHPSDISWSVREKAKLFEHTNQHKLSTGRENYV
jgi:hypothetical protein